MVLTFATLFSYICHTKESSKHIFRRILCNLLYYVISLISGSCNLYRDILLLKYRAGYKIPQVHWVFAQPVHSLKIPLRLFGKSGRFRWAAVRMEFSSTTCFLVRVTLRIKGNTVMPFSVFSLSSCMSGYHCFLVRQQPIWNIKDTSLL